jgi:hypothetical protein
MDLMAINRLLLRPANLAFHYTLYSTAAKDCPQAMAKDRTRNVSALISAPLRLCGELPSSLATTPAWGAAALREKLFLESNYHLEDKR